MTAQKSILTDDMWNMHSYCYYDLLSNWIKLYEFRLHCLNKIKLYFKCFPCTGLQAVMSSGIFKVSKAKKQYNAVFIALSDLLGFLGNAPTEDM